MVVLFPVDIFCFFGDCGYLADPKGVRGFECNARLVQAVLLGKVGQSQVDLWHRVSPPCAGSTRCPVNGLFKFIAVHALKLAHVERKH